MRCVFPRVAARGPCRAPFCEISFDVTFDCESVLMSSSSSSMLPWLLESMCNILSSISLSSFFILAFDTTSWDFRLARSGRSCSTTVPRSCSSRPSEVTKKLSRLTLTDTSGA
eukprot:366021-Chlamydomonas_euryale.AAC.27